MSFKFFRPLLMAVFQLLMENLRIKRIRQLQVDLKSSKKTKTALDICHFASRVSIITKKLIPIRTPLKAQSCCRKYIASNRRLNFHFSITSTTWIALTGTYRIGVNEKGHCHTMTANLILSMKAQWTEPF